MQRLRRLSRRRSARLDEGAFVVEGPTLVAEAFASGVTVTELYVLAGAPSVEPLVATAAVRGVPIHTLSAEALERAATTTTPQAALAVVTLPSHDVEAVFAAAAGRPVLVLDGVADPGNVGTLVRSAAAAGLAAVLTAGPAADPYGPKAVRASAGAVLRLPVATAGPLDDVVAASRAAGYRAIGAVARGGAAPDATDLADRAAIVVGNEAHGLARPDALDATVTIPMAADVESLNAAMAGTLLCFEARRQRDAGSTLFRGAEPSN